MSSAIVAPVQPSAVGSDVNRRAVDGADRQRSNIQAVQAIITGFPTRTPVRALKDSLPACCVERAFRIDGDHVDHLIGKVLPDPQP